MTWRAAFDFAAFQVVWFAAAMGSGAMWLEPAIALSAAVIVLHIVMSDDKRRSLLVLVTAGSMGLVAESTLIAAGIVTYAPFWFWSAYLPAWLAPFWLICVWTAFATTIEATADLLGSRPRLKAALTGLILAPLSYSAAERFGGLAFTEPRWPGLLAIAVLWGLAYPILLDLHLRLTPGRSVRPLNMTT